MRTHTLQFNRTIQEHRDIVKKLVPSLGLANVQYQDLPLITVYKPIYASDEPLPTILYIPGNAFVASETGYTNYICSHLAEQSCCQVIVMKHALAPEYQFPVGLENVKNTFNLLLAKPSNPFGIKIDKTRVAVAGYSSGGNFAALITIQAKKLNIPIARQILISPITDLSRTLKGFEKFEKDDTAISEQFVNWFLDLYIPKNVSPTNPQMSPYWTQESKLRALPPTDIIFGELDRFRGDSENYGNKLAELGNVVHSEMFKGENHGFLWHNNQVINMIAARVKLSFGTESVPRPIKPVQDSHLVTVLYLIANRVETSEKKKSASLRSRGFE